MKYITTTQLALCFCCAALASCANMTPESQKDPQGNLDNPPGGSRYLPPDYNTAPSNPETPSDPNSQFPPPINTPDNNTPPVVVTPTPPVPVTPPTPPPSIQTPYGKPVPGKKGFVYSPFDEKAGMIDVRDYAPGTKVRDPYTNKIFLVP